MGKGQIFTVEQRRCKPEKSGQLKSSVIPCARRTRTSNDGKITAATRIGTIRRHGEPNPASVESATGCQLQDEHDYDGIMSFSLPSRSGFLLLVFCRPAARGELPRRDHEASGKMAIVFSLTSALEQSSSPTTALGLGLSFGIFGTGL
ncbi:hypothetical protein TIFTF001_026127 [Ficus carica]|uniref:Uncharacterized protein n=1 Tax=Ficus carica TaxID=3494 RepID=A0AA88AP40_FICCA|nr:hypothetical protein TIFTF001_026127 [Ficus carica]